MIWTQEQGLVPATMPRAVGRGCGHLSALVLGSLAALVLWLGFEVAWWWVGVSSVTDIEVRHSSHPLDDRRTSVLLTYGMAMGTTTVAVTNRYDPTVASTLAELLGPGVRIRQSNPVEEP